MKYFVCSTSYGVHLPSYKAKTHIIFASNAEEARGIMKDFLRKECLENKNITLVENNGVIDLIYNNWWKKSFYVLGIGEYHECSFNSANRYRL